MTPEQFIDKWSRADRTERQAAQERFIDLCRVLGEPPIATEIRRRSESTRSATRGRSA